MSEDRKLSQLPPLPLPVRWDDALYCTRVGEDYHVPARALMTGQLAITYTGTPRAPLVLQLMSPDVVVPAVAAAGANTYPASGKIAAGGLNYTEVSAVVGPRLLTLSFDNLEVHHGPLMVQNCAALTELAFPSLLRIVAPITPGSTTATGINTFILVGLPALTTLSLPSLEYIGGAVTAQAFSLSNLSSLSLPSLKTVVGQFGATLPALTALSLPSLTFVGGTFQPTVNALTSISLPSLAFVGAFNMNSAAALTSFSAPALVETGAPAFTAPNLVDLTLGTVGTLKHISGNISVTNAKLSQDSVNNLLALLVSLDGTNGTELYGSGRTVNISGGTSAAPSGQGATDKTTLQGRGVTVTTN